VTTHHELAEEASGAVVFVEHECSHEFQMLAAPLVHCLRAFVTTRADFLELRYRRAGGHIEDDKE